MDLIDMLTQTQGGQSVSALGRQFGLDEAQTRAALEQLAPIVAAGLRRNAASDDGLASLVRDLQGGQFARYADDDTPDQLANATLDGNAVLAQIFGSKDVSRGVANQAADLSGIGSAILKKMLPIIAAMILGKLTKSMSGSSPAPRREASSGGLDDLIKDVLGGGKQSAPGSQGGGLGDILGDILGGGRADVPEQRTEAIRRGRETLDDVLGRGTRSGNVADDLLNSVERATRR